MILDNIKNSWKQNIFFMHRLRSDLLSISELTTVNKDTLLELKKKKSTEVLISEEMVRKDMMYNFFQQLLTNHLLCFGL